MQRDHTVVEERFDGNYNSHEGSQFIRPNFNTKGGPIYFDSSSGMYDLRKRCA